MIIPRAHLPKNKDCECEYCKEKVPTKKHFLYFPIGTTTPFDTGDYMAFYLCDECYQHAIATKQAADEHALQQINEGKGYFNE